MTNEILQMIAEGRLRNVTIITHNVTVTTHNLSGCNNIYVAGSGNSHLNAANYENSRNGKSKLKSYKLNN